MINRNVIVSNAFTKIFINPKSKLNARIKYPFSNQVKIAADTHATGTHFSLNLIFENNPVRYKPRMGPYVYPAVLKMVLIMAPLLFQNDITMRSITMFTPMSTHVLIFFLASGGLFPMSIKS